MNLVRANSQVAVPLHTRSVSVTSTLTRHDVQGLTAHRVLLRLARPAVLWVGGQLVQAGEVNLTIRVGLEVLEQGRAYK
jgi:hypothetical protein